MSLTVETLRTAYDAAYKAEHAAKREVYPEAGAKVEVVRGRKIPKGTTGTLVRWGEGEFGRWVNVQPAEGPAFFTSRSNVRFPEIDAEYTARYEAATATKDAYQKLLSEAVALSGINLRNPIAGTSQHRQHAWSDTHEADYACNAECPDDILRYVIGALDSPGNSWGQLRWSTGSSLVSRDGGIARVLSGTGLCD